METKIKGWVVRDKYVQWTSNGPIFDGIGSLNFFVEKPTRQGTNKFWWYAKGDKIQLDPNAFPELKWEDEPLSVELTIKALQ